MNTRYLFSMILAVALLLAGCDGSNTPTQNWIESWIDTNGGLQLDHWIESTAGAVALDLGDIDNDGQTDFASVHYQNQPVQVHLKNGELGTFDMISIAGGGPFAYMRDVEMADFNSDNKLDIAVLINDTGFVPPEDAALPSALGLLIQGSDPRDSTDWTKVYAPGVCYADPTQAGCEMLLAGNETGATDMVVGDFTNDDLPDIVVAHNAPAEDDSTPHTFLYLFVNPGGSAAADESQWTRTTIAANVLDFMQVEAADIDNDGDLDVVATMPASKTWNISWYANSANGATWGFRGLGHQDNGGDAISVGDIDGDGDTDVITGSTEHQVVQWFRNPGPSTLTANAGDQVPWYVFTMCEIGKLDLAGVTLQGAIKRVQLYDLDNNGTLDAFMAIGGVGLELTRGSEVTQAWTCKPIFITDPVADIGKVGFLDVDGRNQIDIVAPLDREGITDDVIVSIFR